MTISDKDNLEFFISNLDLMLAMGKPPFEALVATVEDYAFVYHTNDGRTELNRAAEAVLKRTHEKRSQGKMDSEKLTKELVTFLEIQDERVRQEAVLAWWGMLSKGEQEKVRTIHQEFAEAMIDNLIPAFGQLVGVLAEWLKQHPELATYLETMNTARSDN